MLGVLGAFCGVDGDVLAQSLHERSQEKNIPNIKKKLGCSRNCQEARGAGAQGIIGYSQQLGQSTSGQGEKFDFFFLHVIRGHWRVLEEPLTGSYVYL